MSRGLERLKELVATVGRTLAFPHDRDEEQSCGDGCYTLGDGTLVPLGDLGLRPTEYKLKP